MHALLAKVPHKMFKIEWKKCHWDHADIPPNNKRSVGQWNRKISLAWLAWLNG